MRYAISAVTLSVCVGLLVRCYNGQMIGFDCSHDNINITTISLHDVQPCEFNGNRIEEITVSIQLVQPREVISVHVYVCHVSVDRLITRCSTWEDAQVVEGGFINYIPELTPQQCRDIHRTQYFHHIEGQVFNGIKPNSSISFSAYVARQFDHTGNCKGTTFRFGSRKWDDVVVQDKITLNIQDYTATVSVDTGNIQLRGGLYCEFAKGSCLDFANGFTTWDVTERDKCSDTAYDVIYQGPSIKARSVSSDGIVLTTYTVNSDDHLFALAIRREVPLCMFTGYSTEHPKLFIIEAVNNHFYFKKVTLVANGMDMFAYVNTKFVYLEKHIKKQLINLHHTYRQITCELHRKILITQLNQARVDSNGFARAISDNPGFSAITAGEVIHIIKCQAVEVRHRRTTNCYDEWPVVYRNKSMFMKPLTRLLVEFGTQIECSDIMGPLFKMGKNWLLAYPRVHTVKSPITLSPTFPFEWRYEDAGNLARSGLYTQEDVERLKKQIMFPSEREAITNIFARGATDDQTDIQRIKVINLIPDIDFINKISSWWDQGLRIFKDFGIFTAGFIGILFIFRMIKFVLDTLVHFFELRQSYHKKIFWVAACWDSLTQYLIHRKLRTTTGENNLSMNTEAPATHNHISSAPEEEQGGPHLTTVQRLYPEL